MRSQDTKKLWARSGNICSFPECGVELTSSKEVNRVLGEEAHIKGEKPGAARYDEKQSKEERESYDNKILLCPNHHTIIDAEPQFWTVEMLYEIKRSHEEEIKNNRRHPFLLKELESLIERYSGSSAKPRELEDFTDTDSIPVYDIIDSNEPIRIIRIEASIEKGVNTQITVKAGQRLLFLARGLITFDGGKYFANPEGFICNEYGLPYATKNGNNQLQPTMWVHPEAYTTNGDMAGRIGSLYGWVNSYSPENAFFIGAKREIEFTSEGVLFLAINDARGTYEDNDGEYRVDIRLISPE